MADKSKIEWTESTWQVTRGCSVVSPGCANCYAMKQAYRITTMGNAKYAGLTMGSNAGPVWNGQVRLVDEAELTTPMRWKRGRMIFVNSMSDLFHASVPFAWIASVFAVMQLTPQHRYQVLTKRIERARQFLEDPETRARISIARTELGDESVIDFTGAAGWPLPNVWLGTSVEDQARADERIPHLLASPAAVRFISAEPLLGAVDIAWALSGQWPEIAAGFLARGHFSPGAETLRPLDWVIAGGESQDGARPMHPLWIRGIREQCKAAGVPFFFKQWGAWAPSLTLPLTERQNHGAPGTIGNVRGGEARAFIAGDQYIEMRRIGKPNSGALLDGREWREWPRVP